MTAEASGGPRLRRLLTRASISLLLLAGAFLLIAFSIGADDVRTSLEGIDVQTVLLLLCLSSFNYLARAARWVLLFRAVDLRGPGRSLNAIPIQFLIYLGGYALTLTPGRAGEAIRAWMANESFGTPADAGLSLVVADRFYDAVALTIILLVAGMMLARTTAAPLIMIVILGSSILVLSRAAAAQRLFARLAALVPRLSKVIIAIGGTIANLGVVTRPTKIPLLTLPSLLGWLAQSLAPAVVLNDMGVAIALSASIFVFAFATLIGGATFLPGGLGGFEATMIGLLAAMDVPISTAVVATLVMRMGTLWFGIVLGIATFMLWTLISGVKTDAPVRGE